LEEGRKGGRKESSIFLMLLHGGGKRRERRSNLCLLRLSLASDREEGFFRKEGEEKGIVLSIA